MNSIPFRSIKGFASIFCDYMESVPYISQRFPHIDIQQEEVLIQKAQRYDRTLLMELLHSSLRHITLSEKQQSNLEKVALPNTLTIITGQQVGFLGGPLYTLYKAYSAIHEAESLQSQFKNLHCIPLFWIEDNDHDRQEAGTAYILDKQGIPQKITCPADTNISSLTSVSELRITDEIVTVLAELEQQLPDTEFTQKLIPLLQSIYTVGTEWSLAFMRLMNIWFGEKGLLFIRASDVRTSGAFADIITQELSHPLQTYHRIGQTNEELRQHGYTPQVEPSLVHVFHHQGGMRKKITYDDSRFHAGEITWTYDEILQEVKQYPENFSPNVLLRPLCQDHILPALTYIAGPGECAYFAQLKECYELFGVDMPMIHARHSGTLVLPQHQRLLDKAEQSPFFFMRKYIDIEQDILDKMNDKELEKLATETHLAFEQALLPLIHYGERTDQTLKGAGAAAHKAVMDSVDTFKKKIIAAKKRQEQTSFDRAKSLNNFLFPESALQERILSPIAIITKMSWQSFQETINSLTAMSNQSHHIITFTH